MLSIDGYEDEGRAVLGPHTEVRRAVRTHDGLSVVLKAASAADRDPEIEREAGFLRRVSHEGVTALVDLARAALRPVLVLERAPGVPLSEIGVSEPLASRELLDIAAKLARALEAVHGQCIIHRSVRPEHVLVDRESGRVTLIGFGAATELGAADVRLQTQDLRYIAPEQTGRMNRGIDARSDLYSLGACLYQLVSGRPPFDADDALELIHSHIAKSPRSLVESCPGLPPTLSRIVMKLLEKEPEARYQTAKAVAVDLEQSKDQLERLGSIDDSFPLGTADFPERPLFSSHLFGRERELEQLEASFAEAVAGRAGITLLAGPPGIGKSSLVAKLREPIANASGYLVQGKFDLYRQDLPYHGLVGALQLFAQQLLTEPGEKLEVWRGELERALGGVARVIVDLVPEFGFVLGDLPALPDLGPEEARARLSLAVRRLIGACATRAHPLVLALDDLQWADRGSLELIADLVVQHRDLALLVLGTYRDNEVDPEHRLAHMLDEVRTSGARIGTVVIDPLGEDSTTALLEHALHRPAEIVRPLAKLIGLKSGHNPLLIQQLTHHLQAQGLIYFSHGTGWDWDEEAIAAVDVPDDAVELMTRKIASLDDAERETLQFASCVGDEISAATLAELGGKDTAEVEQLLYRLSAAGLIAPCPRGFRFTHDRIRESAQSLLTKDEREMLHYCTARLVLDRISPEERDVRIFELADHLGHAGSRVPESERWEALLIYDAAARTSLVLGAVATASHYFGLARRALRDGDWDAHHALLFGLFVSNAESEIQAGRFGHAERLLDELEPRCAGAFEFATMAGKRLQLYSIVKGPDGSIGYLIEALGQLGIHWPAEPSRLRVWIEILRAEWALRRLRPDVKLSGNIDADWLAPLLLIGASAGMLARASAALAMFCSCYGLRVMAQRDWPLSPAFAVAAYAMNLMRLTRLWSRARRHAACAAQIPVLPDMAIRNAVMLKGCIGIWFEPRRRLLADVAPLALRAYEAGDHEYGYYLSLMDGVGGALIGDPVDVSREKLERLASDRYRRAAEICLLAHGLLFEPLGSDAVIDARLDQARDLIERDQRGVEHPAFTYWMLVLCILGRFERAFALAEPLADTLFTVSPFLHMPDFPFLRGFAAYVVAERTGDRAAARAARECTRLVRRFARYGPDSEHTALFLSAEEGRKRGGKLDPRYEAAARMALERGYSHHAAMIYERCGDLLRQQRRETAAEEYERQAAAIYRRWGALAKVPNGEKPGSE